MGESEIAHVLGQGIGQAVPVGEVGSPRSEVHLIDAHRRRTVQVTMTASHPVVVVPCERFRIIRNH
jgi:hypothetical protein